MTLAVGLVLAVLTFVFIAYPLFKRKPPLADSVGDEKLQELHSKRDTTYSMLKELEFDFQAGTLTEEDYQDLETRYKRKAISILKELDGSEKSTEIDEEIEKQVRELRQSRGRFCTQCGASCQESDSFCSRCGASLGKGERVD